MSNKQILEKAITKAIEGGWEGFRTTDKSGIWYTGATPEQLLKAKYYDDISQFVAHEVPIGLNEVIYNHDFAKALWPVLKPLDYGIPRDASSSRFSNVKSLLPDWKYHLQQMVISDDPIQYLKNNAL